MKLTLFHFYHPFKLIGFQKSTVDTETCPSDSLTKYGFCLDLTTEISWYTYDYGTGFVFRILGLGLEVCKVRC